MSFKIAELTSKQKDVVETLLSVHENENYKDVSKDKCGLVSILFKAGYVNKKSSYNNYSMFEQVFNALKQEYIITKKDLEEIELYLSLSEVDIKRSSLFDYWFPAMMSFIFFVFGSLMVYQLEVVEEAPDFFVYWISAFLVSFGAGLKAFVLKRRSAFMNKSLVYSQSRILVRSKINQLK